MQQIDSGAFYVYSIISVSLYFVLRYMQQEKHTGRRSDGNSERFNLNCNSCFGFLINHPT